MAASVQIPLIEYLQADYEPDREYIDGALWERNVGKFEHSRVQTLLAIWFGMREDSTGLMVIVEQRVQVSPTRVRIPDVVLVPIGEQPEVLVDAPFLAIDVLSPADSYANTQRRADDYVQMGVEHLWIIDPTTRSARMRVAGAWIETAQLSAGRSISLDLSTLLQSLDRAS